MYQQETLFGPNDAALETHVAEESLVADRRAGETPTQVVERKLVTLMKGKQLPLSCLQTRRLRCPSA